MDQRILFCLASLALVLFSDFITTAEGGIGVNYGMLGDNLPNAKDVISLYQSRGIPRMRIFAPTEAALQALQGSGIEVVVGTYNEDLQQIATSYSFATNWVQTNIAPYAPTVSFRYLVVGTEVIPGDRAGYVLAAMKNLDAALKAASISLPVTTAVSMDVLGASYPPSQGSFSAVAGPIMETIVAFLAFNGSPLLVDVYPYFAYAADQKDIRLDYALFTASGVVVQDGNLGYQNLFDAMLDAVYSALEKVGAASVDVVVAQTGWPSAGNGGITTEEYALIYNNNAVGHAMSGDGTPKRPGKEIETYLFAMFNEDLKPVGYDQNWGLFYPNMTQVYPVIFNP